MWSHWLLGYCTQALVNLYIQRKPIKNRFFSSFFFFTDYSKTKINRPRQWKEQTRTKLSLFPYITVFWDYRTTSIVMYQSIPSVIISLPGNPRAFDPCSAPHSGAFDANRRACTKTRNAETKPPKRNDRNGRNETTKTNETTETMRS